MRAALGSSHARINVYMSASGPKMVRLAEGSPMESESGSCLL